MITRTVRTDDGVSLALHRLDAAGRGDATPVLLAHGAFASHTVWLRGGAHRAGLARFLAERGHDVWLADWRHHGASQREPRPFHWHFEDVIRRDAPALLNEMRRETGVASCIWVGHSYGGAIGLALLARDSVAGPAGVVTLGTPGPVMGPGRRAMAWLSIGICRAAGRFPARTLRLGSEDEPALVLSEWMTWNVRGRWLGADGFDYLAALERIAAPVLAIAGSRDRVFAPARACRDLVDRLGEAATTFAVAGLDHRGLLLDSRADELCWPLIEDWLARLSPARRPSARATP